MKLNAIKNRKLNIYIITSQIIHSKVGVCFIYETFKSTQF